MDDGTTRSLTVADDLYELSLTEPTKFRNILQLTVDEVERRLDDPDERRQIENVQLFRLLDRLWMVKRDLDRNDKQTVTERKVTSVLELITGITDPKRQAEVLEDAIRLKRQSGADYEPEQKALERITGGK